MTERDKGGKFVKGKSGNPSGRPKGVKLTAAQREMFKDDPKKALLWLMNTAEDRRELLSVAKLVIDYVSPKLSAIKQEVKKDTKMVIEWKGVPNKPVIDAEFETVKPVDEESLGKLTEKELQEVTQEALKEIDASSISS